MAKRYQRARSEAQKAERREQILVAAEEMLSADCSLLDLSLNELARTAGMAKSNLYRYFDSREAVFLAILLDRVEEWSAEMLQRLGAIDLRQSLSDRLRAVTAVLTESTVARPQMCELFSVLATVLEHNVEEETLRGFKLSSVEQVVSLASAMHAVVPELAMEEHAELLHHAFTYIVGAWPLANPSEVALEVMKDPVLAPMRHDFATDLEREVLLVGLGLLALKGEA